MYAQSTLPPACGWAAPAPRPCAREQRERFRPSSRSPHARDLFPTVSSLETVEVGPSSNRTCPGPANLQPGRRGPVQDQSDEEAGAGNGRNPRALGPTDWPRPQSCLSRIALFPLGGAGPRAAFTNSVPRIRLLHGHFRPGSSRLAVQAEVPDPPLRRFRITSG